jgi:homoserine kinase
MNRTEGEEKNFLEGNKGRETDRSRPLRARSRRLSSPSRKSSSFSSWISVFAPASVANFGVGFDVLGAALEGPGDVVRARLTDKPGVRLIGITGDGGRLPLSARRNTAAVAAAAVLEAAGERRRGIELTLAKGLPLSSGMGSSAASAAAGALAAGLLLGLQDRAALLRPALLGEHVADGSWHGDNVFASLLGGLVLVPSSDPDGPLQPVRLKVPSRLRLVLVHPALELETRRARGVLPRKVLMAVHVASAASLAGFVAALAGGDLERAGRALLEDRLVDPARLPLIPGGRAVLDAMLAAGAYGACLAGAGPALLALTEDGPLAGRVARAAETAWRRAGITAHAAVHRLDARGARRGRS